MAITQSDFLQIPSSGVIPEPRVPASEFAVGYAFTYVGTPSLDTFNHTFTGTILLHVLDSGGAIKYVISIEETYNLLIFPLAPGLALYTWNWVPSEEKISGTIGDGADAPPMTTLGAGSFGVDPAEDSGTTDREVQVNSTFYSGIFTEPLDVGDTLKIKFHNLSAGFVVDRASLLLATVPGGAVLRSLFHGATGQTFLLYADGAATKIARTRRMQPVLALHQDETDTHQSAATICDYEATVEAIAPRYAALHRARGALYCPLQSSARFRLWRSVDEGREWYVMADVQVFNQTILASAMDGAAATLYLYGTAAADDEASGVKRGDAVYAEVKSEGAAWKLSATGKVTGDNLPVKDIAGLEYADGVLRLTAKSAANALTVLLSRDGLRTLEAVALT